MLVNSPLRPTPCQILPHTRSLPRHSLILMLVPLSPLFLTGPSLPPPCSRAPRAPRTRRGPTWARQLSHGGIQGWDPWLMNGFHKHLCWFCKATRSQSQRPEWSQGKAESELGRWGIVSPPLCLRAGTAAQHLEVGCSARTWPVYPPSALASGHLLLRGSGGGGEEGHPHSEAGCRFSEGLGSGE